MKPEINMKVKLSARELFSWIKDDFRFVTALARFAKLSTLNLLTLELLRLLADLFAGFGGSAAAAA